MGTEVQEKKGTAEGMAEGSGSAAAAPANDEGRSFEEIFNAAMDEPEGDGGAEKEGAGAAGGEGGGAEKKPDAAAEAAPAAEKPAESPNDAAAAAEGAEGAGSATTGLTDEDKVFLKTIGLEGYSPSSAAELANLKKAYGVADAKYQDAERRATFYGTSNAQISGNYKKLKAAYREVMKQQSPSDRAKGIISKIDKTKLSAEARELLEDPAYLEVNSAIMAAILPQEQQALSGINLDGDDDVEAAAAAGSGHTAAGGGQPAMPTNPEEAKERVKQNIRTVAEKLKDSHPDMLEIYQRPDFREFFNNLSTIEAMKAFSDDPKAHDELLTRYKTVHAERLAAEAASKASTTKKDDLRTHQAPAKPGPAVAQKGDEGPSPDEIMNDDKAFDAITEKVAKARVRTG